MVAGFVMTLSSPRASTSSWSWRVLAGEACVNIGAFLRESCVVTYITYLNRIMGALRNEASVTSSNWAAGQNLVHARVSAHKAIASLEFCPVAEISTVLSLSGQGSSALGVV